jgi:hypothetical protein
MRNPFRYCRFYMWSPYHRDATCREVVITNKFSFARPILDYIDKHHAGNLMNNGALVIKQKTALIYSISDIGMESHLTIRCRTFNIAPTLLSRMMPFQRMHGSRQLTLFTCF